jgi:hypothetical protein
MKKAPLRNFRGLIHPGQETVFLSKHEINRVICDLALS